MKYGGKVKKPIKSMMGWWVNSSSEKTTKSFTTKNYGS